MLHTPEYSAKERELFKALAMADIIDHIEPYAAYRIAVENAFVTNATGPAIESLRRCYIAYKECKIYRMTPQWDALIELN